MLGATSTAQAVAAFLGGRRYPQGRALRQPLVGRDADVATAVEDLRHDRALLVVGYGGIGKSALLDTVVGADGRPTRSAAALASMGWREYWPLSAALGGMSLTGDVEAVAAIVEAEVGPDVLVVDDLHLADRSTIEVLAALAGRVALAGACRPDEGNGPAAVERLREAGLDVLVLTPLDSSSAAVLTRSLAPDLPPARVEAIVAGAASFVVTSAVIPEATVADRAGPEPATASGAMLSVEGRGWGELASRSRSATSRGRGAATTADSPLLVAAADAAAAGAGCSTGSVTLPTPAIDASIRSLGAVVVPRASAAAAVMAAAAVCGCDSGTSGGASASRREATRRSAGAGVVTFRGADCGGASRTSSGRSWAGRFDDGDAGTSSR